MQTSSILNPRSERKSEGPLGFFVLFRILFVTNIRHFESTGQHWRAACIYIYTATTILARLLLLLPLDFFAFSDLSSSSYFRFCPTLE